ncbi:hypothetical protein [Corynebacterium massiliense]|nr:hypothetical protein [Corynebacterium massiliense]
MDALTQLVVDAPVWVQLPVVLAVLLPLLSAAAWVEMKLIDAVPKGTDD